MLCGQGVVRNECKDGGRRREGGGLGVGYGRKVTVVLRIHVVFDGHVRRSAKFALALSLAGTGATL